MKYLIAFLTLIILNSCVSPTMHQVRNGEVSPRKVIVPLWSKKLVKHQRFSQKNEEFSTPVFDKTGKRIIVGTSEGKLICFNLKGQTLWTTNLKTSINSAPLHLKQFNLIIAGTIGGKLYGVDADSGKKKWKFQGYGSFLGKPVYKNGVVYITTTRNMLYAIAVDDGSLHWSKRNETVDGYTVRGHSSPVIDGNHLFMGLSDGQILAVDLQKRGQTLWKKALEDPNEENYIDADADAVIKGDKLYTASYNKGLCVLDKNTGELIWNYRAYGITSITLHKDKIYFVSPSKGIHCLNTSGKLIWRQNIDLGTPGKIVVKGKRMIIPFDQGGIIALNPDNGFFYQRFDPGDGISSNFAIFNNLIAALLNNGSIYLFKIT
ncbi:MAG: PQQ-binding-like beta-propeller repeat protein [Deltaproteobacteria bacterium]|jgi:outer membrane protein assembly factor BamB|nr:PQQ-binding-like beta-propeller repeat protein [Deltaproteobacteria bacterium]